MIEWILAWLAVGVLAGAALGRMVLNNDETIAAEAEAWRLEADNEQDLDASA